MKKHHSISKLVCVALLAICSKSYSQTNTHISSINLFPNPAVDGINITFESDTAGIIVIDVNDLSGRKPIQINTEVVNGFNRIVINLNDIDPDIYFINLCSKEETETREFLKEE